MQRLEFTQRTWFFLSYFPERYLAYGTAKLLVHPVDLSIKKIEYLVYNDNIEQPIPENSNEEPIIGNETYSLELGPCHSNIQIHPLSGYRYLRTKIITGESNKKKTCNLILVFDNVS